MDELMREYEARVDQIIADAERETGENPWFAYENAKRKFFELFGWGSPEFYVYAVRRLGKALGV